MKVWAPIVALAGLATAATSEKPVDVIVDQLKNIINTTGILTTAILGFNGLEQAVSLLAANTAVLGAVNNGTQKVLTLDQTLLNDALTLPPYVLQLSQLTNQSIEAIISKKPVFVQNNLGPITYQSLEQLNCASTQFTNATNSRLPGGGINAASDQISAPIFASFQAGLAAYEDQKQNGSAPYNCSYVNGTSRGLNPADVQGGAGMLSASNGLTMIVAATLASLFMI